MDGGEERGEDRNRGEERIREERQGEERRGALTAASGNYAQQSDWDSGLLLT